MATPRCRAQVTLERQGALAEDSIVNVWHFEGDDQEIPTDADVWADLAPGLVTRLTSFYQGLASRMANTLTGNATVRLYDMRQPRPRVPVVEQDFALGALGTASLPNEVALCLSMQGTREAGIPMARRRGRVYLGPWAHSQAGNAPYSGDSRPAQSLIDAVLAGVQNLARGTTSGNFRLAVYSPTSDPLGTGAPDEAWNDVATMWVDDAWDTQRRRGAKPTTRTTVALTG